MDGLRRKQLADFGANVQDEMIVVDKNIITSTGPSTGLNVAFRLLEMLTNLENVNIVKKYMRSLLTIERLVQKGFIRFVQRMLPCWKPVSCRPGRMDPSA